jgi:HEAT repeat
VKLPCIRVRYFVVSTLLLGILVPLGVYLVPPLLRGEHFYRLRPSSEWSREIQRWEENGRRRIPSWPDKVIAVLTCKTTPDAPEILNGGPDSLPVLLDLIHNSTTKVHVQALWALHHPWAAKEPVLRAVSHGLIADDGYVAEASYSTLRELASEEETVTILLELLQDEQPSARIDAVVVLGSIAWQSRNDRAPIRVLIKLLDDEIEVRCQAALGLRAAALDEPTTQVRQALERALKDKSAKVREAATAALATIEAISKNRK